MPSSVSCIVKRSLGSANEPCHGSVPDGLRDRGVGRHGRLLPRVQERGQTPVRLGVVRVPRPPDRAPRLRVPREKAPPRALRLVSSASASLLRGAFASGTTL